MNQQPPWYDEFLIMINHFGGHTISDAVRYRSLMEDSDHSDHRKDDYRSSKAAFWNKPNIPKPPRAVDRAML